MSFVSFLEWVMVDRGGTVRSLKTMAWAAVCLLACVCHGASAASPSSEPDVRPARAVPTFRSIGLYWSPGQTGTCSVEYQKNGDTVWKTGLPLWFDARDNEYRGSLVGLEPGVGYRVRLSLAEGRAVTELEAATWAETFPVARVITLPEGRLDEPYVITEGGDAGGYVLYQAAPGGTAIDVAGAHDQCVRIRASRVILRGVRLENPARHGVVIEGPQTDVVVERCDIRGWGRVATDGYGENLDSAIYANTPGTARLIIRDNRLHHPRSNSNDWSQPRPGTGERLLAHPNGPQGIFIRGSAGNNVICHNEIFSDERHRFNDGMGEWNNYSNDGFPGPDSDIYNNYIANVADDAVEAEGGGCNVRVWGNLFDYTYHGVAAAVCGRGPLYVFRNVMGVARKTAKLEDGGDNRGSFAKLGSGKGYGGGRIFFFHNTVLQPISASGIALGARCGLADWGGPMTQVVSRNNIWWLAPPSDGHGSHAIYVRTISETNDFDHDLYTGAPRAPLPDEPGGVRATPIIVPGPALKSQSAIAWPWLAPDSPGCGQAVSLPNFNETAGDQPADIGAAQAGVAAPVIGVRPE